MNQATAYANESQFGPPSELVDIYDFLRQCRHYDPLTLVPSGSASIQDWDRLPGLTAEQKAAVEKECSLDDVQASLINVLREPALYAHIVTKHEEDINTIYETTHPSKGRKRKRKTTLLNEGDNEAAKVAEFRRALDGVQLRSWPYTKDSAAFVRAPKNSDSNVLAAARKVSTPRCDAAIETSDRFPDALLTISVHTRLSWGNYVSRTSQHAVLASQTLGDLYECILCPSNEIPTEQLDGDMVVGYGENVSEHRGAVMCIENVAYGDGQNEEDYSDKLMKHIETMPEDKRPLLKKGASMHEQTFASLCLHLHQPYWLLHQGTCEHFLVVDQIRLLHPIDVQEEYPMTVQITPPILDLCQACSKAPAVWSIVGDVRLGQSPCILCAPCWRHMGEGGRDAGVVVVPLPKHQLGW